MSVHVHLVDPPEYYTNLDVIRGEAKFFLAKPETIGAVVVKLEGESETALTVPAVEDEEGWTYKHEALRDLDPSRSVSATPRPVPGTVVQETHKILYQVAQLFPPKTDEPSVPAVLPAGQHTFPFQFKLPFNNACADPMALARSGGMVDAEGNAEPPNGGPLRFGLSSSGIRIMDGSKQLLYSHVKQTLPPSGVGFLRAAETNAIRYFIKATVQRPGMFKGNRRGTTDFKFLPIEPLRPPPSTREVFARRPFTFRDRAPPSDAPALKSKNKSGFFRSEKSGASTLSLPDVSAGSASSSPLSTSPLHHQFSFNAACRSGVTPSIQLSALLPYPAILTCNEPVPLRLIARKLQPSREEVLLTSLDIRLIETTRLKSQDLEQAKTATWIVMTRIGLSIPVCEPDAPVNSELVISDDIWRDRALPNTVMPSFITCNISREYQLEVRAGLTWGVFPLDEPLTLASETTTVVGLAHNEKQTKKVVKELKKEQKAAKKALKAMKPRPAHLLPQTITLPLTFHAVHVYSGIKPNQMLVDAVTKHRQRMSMLQENQRQQQQGPPQRPDQHPALHSRQYDYHQTPYPPRGAGPQPGRQFSNNQPLQHTQRWPQQRGFSHELEQGPPVFELSSEQAPAIPPRPGGSAVAPPVSPLSPLSPTLPTLSAGPRAAEVSGLPVIRRRPVPQRFAAQQRQEQQQTKNREKLSSGDASSPPLPFGQVQGSVHQRGPQQQYHLYQQQTFADPLYPPQLQPAEDPASMALSELPPSPGAARAGGGATGGIVTEDGQVLVSYKGVVSPMAPAVASAIDAFAFADADAASAAYQDPPPSYDEAMAEVMSAAAEGSGGDISHGAGGAAAQRPAFGGETGVNANTNANATADAAASTEGSRQ